MDLEDARFGMIYCLTISLLGVIGLRSKLGCLGKNFSFFGSVEQDHGGIIGRGL